MKKNKNSLTSEQKNHLSEHLGYRIRYLLQKYSGGNTKAFLLETGINERQLYRLCNGGNPTFYTICEVAMAFGIHPMELLNFNLKKKVRDKNFIHGLSFKNEDFDKYVSNKDYKEHKEKEEDFDFSKVKSKSSKK